MQDILNIHNVLPPDVDHVVQVTSFDHASHALAMDENLPRNVSIWIA